MCEKACGELIFFNNRNLYPAVLARLHFPHSIQSFCENFALFPQFNSYLQEKHELTKPKDVLKQRLVY